MKGARYSANPVNEIVFGFTLYVCTYHKIIRILIVSSDCEYIVIRLRSSVYQQQDCDKKNQFDVVDRVIINKSNHHHLHTLTYKEKFKQKDALLPIFRNRLFTQPEKEYL